VKVIFKLFKSLLNILILTTLIASVIAWSSFSPEKRSLLLEKLEAITPFSIFNTSQKIKSTIAQQLRERDSELAQETLDILSETFGNSNEHFQLFDQDCGTPQTNPLKQKASKKIFQWKDEHGQIHFGDAKEGQNAQDISEQYKTRTQFISLVIKSINTSLPLDLENTIKISNSKMFMVLSDALNINQLHQLELSLNLFGNEQDFKVYLKDKAPQLKQALGFYIAKDNEASILIQPQIEQTMGLIRHESSHVMMANLYGHSPIWLNEGFAEYFQGLKVSGFETTIYPSGYSVNLLRNAHKAASLSLTNHFNLSVAEWQGQNVNQHYAEAWSIVYFMLSDPKRKRILGEYFNALNEDRCIIPDASQFFALHYSGGLRKMDQDWKTWLMQREIHPHRY